MAPSSALPTFEPQAFFSKQSDLLIHALLSFGRLRSSPDPPTTRQIDQLKPEEIENELAELSASSEGEIDAKVQKLIRSRVYQLDGGDTEVAVRSWNMLEHVYRRAPCPFPTLARGLFTREHVRPDCKLGEGRHQIVARGYDKFFNVDELPSTKWDALATRSKPPYHLTLKTNGCIIFLAALTPTHLLVTSKHATGAGDPDYLDQPISHSDMGERWVERHLSAVGLDKSQLARELWDANATAIAELTDDDFEEHVIPTPSAEVGLNLHGINLNTPGLLTFPPDVVAQCAKRWGMHPTPYTTVDTLNAVREHCSRIEHQGWPGREGSVEGIVVRGLPVDRSAVTDGKPGPAVFWKVKFEEPYLTYREWRELTRKMLSEMETSASGWKSACSEIRSRPLSLADSERLAKELNINVGKIRRPETRLYVHWAIDQLFNQRPTFDTWKENRGIITSREDFLEWRKSPAAHQVLCELDPSVRSSESKSQAKTDQKFDKTLLVPIAIPGCGKTTLAVGLKTLLGCAHTQSDNIRTKKTGPAFVESVKTLLLAQDGPKLVVADKNNHLKTHRQALVEVVDKLRKGVPIKQGPGKKGPQQTTFAQVNTRLVAIVWDLGRHSQAELHRMACERIDRRGDNHQSLRPELTAGGVAAHEGILWRFLSEFEEFDPVLNRCDEPFDEVIEIRFTDSTEESLKSLWDQLARICPDILAGIDLTPERAAKALTAAKEYRAEVKKEMKIDSKAFQPRYYGIKLEVDLEKLFNELIPTSARPSDRWFVDQLGQKNRFTKVPHVTLIHTHEVQGAGPAMKAEWDHYEKLVRQKQVQVEMELGPKLVWNDRVMVIEARLKQDRSAVVNRNGKRFHVTIGTMDEEIRPIEGKRLLEEYFQRVDRKSWRHPLDVRWMDVRKVTVKGVIQGLK